MGKVSSTTPSPTTKEQDKDKKNGVETDTKESIPFHAISKDDNQNIDQYLLGVLDMVDANSESMCLSDMYIEDIIKRKQY